MRGHLNIGEVNCDEQKQLCKKAGVRGYPTMLLYRGGERMEYDGLRGIGDLVSYAEQVTAISGGVQEVDAEEFKKLEEKEEVIFTYFYDHATTSEDFQALERLTMSLIGKAKLVKTNDAELAKRFKISTWPRLMVSRDGKPSYYPPITPKEMRDTTKIRTWMKSVWLPLVPELTSSNAHEIMNGKMVVLAILSREDSDQFILSKRELKNAAKEWIDKQDKIFQLERQELRDTKQLRIEEAEDKDDQRALRDAKSITIDMDKMEHTQVGFAWVDGQFWERWIRTTYGIDAKDGSRVVINDEDVSHHHPSTSFGTNAHQHRRYWDTTSSGDPIRLSRASILETITKVTANPPKIAPKSTTGTFTGMLLSVQHAFRLHPYIGLGMFLGLFAAIVLFGRRRRSFGKGGYINLGEKDGLLGGGNNGGAKHD
jgi:protein disulfide-isomerase